MKRLIFLNITFVFFSILTISLIEILTAVTMESSMFRIESANTSIAAGEKSSSNYRLSDTLGQVSASEFSSAGYIVKAGFQYLKSVIPFKFSISSTNINFGTLVPNTPVTASLTLTVSFGASGEYQVMTAEIHPLKTPFNTIIPDTSCDGGSETCTESVAKLWSSTSAYGFGYNMSGQDIPSDFDSPLKFRPFPDLSNGENPAVVMSSTNVGRNRQATMTLKVNVSSIQPAGSYQTIINFIATPSF